jgi:hypothetical protein
MKKTDQTLQQETAAVRETLRRQNERFRLHFRLALVIAVAAYVCSIAYVEIATKKYLVAASPVSATVWLPDEMTLVPDARSVAATQLTLSDLFRSAYENGMFSKTFYTLNNRGDGSVAYYGRRTSQNGEVWVSARVPKPEASLRFLGIPGMPLIEWRVRDYDVKADQVTYAVQRTSPVTTYVMLVAVVAFILFPPVLLLLSWAHRLPRDQENGEEVPA